METSDSQKPSEGLSGVSSDEAGVAELDLRAFFEKSGNELQLEALTRLEDARFPIRTADIHRPGLVLAGFLENFPHDRIQILGKSETSYLVKLAKADRRRIMEQLCEFEIPGIIVTRSLPVPEGLIELAVTKGIAVLRSPVDTTQVIRHTQSILDEHFSPATTVHATLVDVYGVGLLFTGRSGIGKSECGLDLVERGHRLVADDVVIVKRRHENNLIGRGHELAGHNMEIRGIGIIDVQAIFGIRAIRAQKRIEVEVNLREWDETKDYERLGVEEQHTSILGVRIPLVVVPIFPGKNITVISETIAMNYLVKEYGYNPAEHFGENLLQMLRRKANLDVLARDDLE